MNEYLLFALSTVAGTLVSVIAYALLASRRVPVTSRVGVGLLGASVGTFGGMMLALAYDLTENQYLYISTTAFFSIAASIGFQRAIFRWSRTTDDL